MSLVLLLLHWLAPGVCVCLCRLCLLLSRLRSSPASFVFVAAGCVLRAPASLFVFARSVVQAFRRKCGSYHWACALLAARFVHMFRGTYVHIYLRMCYRSVYCKCMCICTCVCIYIYSNSNDSSNNDNHIIIDVFIHPVINVYIYIYAYTCTYTHAFTMYRSITHA